jgi:hypothetical protein
MATTTGTPSDGAMSGMNMPDMSAAMPMMPMSTKPACGTQGRAQTYDLPLHVAALCESMFLPKLKSAANNRYQFSC